MRSCTPTTIRYDEGAEVGCRWFAKTGAKALFAFGHGLSYPTFADSDLTAGAYRIALGRSADDLLLTAESPLTSHLFGK